MIDDTSATSVVTAAAFCPHPPLLIPALGAAEPVVVRDVAMAAVRWLAEQEIDRLVVLGAGETPRCFSAGAIGTFAGFGVDYTVQLPGPADPTAGRLPLSLAVGAWLLSQTVWSGSVIALECGPDGAVPAFPRGARDGLLVMGDGSARRSEKAPGWLDPRAFDFDHAVGTALGSGDVAALAVDLVLGAELLAAGAPAWSAASRLLAGRQWEANVCYDDAPYGVGYLVATWQARQRP